VNRNCFRLLPFKFEVIDIRTMPFKLPPLLYNEEGSLRKVGFELEFSNLGIAESVGIIQEMYGGEVQEENRFSQKVVGTSLGDFNVEFDLTLLTEKGYEKVFDKFNISLEDVKLGESTLEEGVETVLESIDVSAPGPGRKKRFTGTGHLSWFAVNERLLSRYALQKHQHLLYRSA